MMVLSGRLTLIVATLAYYAASLILPASSMWFFGSIEGAATANLVVLSTTSSFLSLSGLHLRIAAGSNSGEVIDNAKVAMLCGMLFLTAFSPGLYAYYYWSNLYEHTAFLVVMVLCVAFLFNTLIYYFLVAVDRDAYAAVARLLSALPPALVGISWWANFTDFQGGLKLFSLLSLLISCALLLTIGKIVPDFRKKINIIAVLKDPKIKSFVIHNLYLSSASVVSTTLVLLLPPATHGAAQYLLIYYGSRVVAAALQGYGNPVSQWLVRDLSSCFEHSKKSHALTSEIAGYWLQRLILLAVILVIFLLLCLMVSSLVSSENAANFYFVLAFLCASALQITTSPFTPALNVFGFRNRLIAFENVRIVLSITCVALALNSPNFYDWWFATQAINYFLLGLIIFISFRKMDGSRWNLK